ncbi:hypothetical protein BDF20DRAFT_888874 [Mycotypha africana]|uniref:uncharacterized protein n=1 Tax=Mycotypha africana TaxID=64632 RepID=UPI002300C4DA|nr:uncharacterized protein BDF20DRAFT_888874 [Mycotypha africana]KAI8970013.1 hypothetical protein BDF20DRAFT_888874 [Mycotypha africana]
MATRRQKVVCKKWQGSFSGGKWKIKWKSADGRWLMIARRQKMWKWQVEISRW